MQAASGPADPQCVISARFAHAQQCACAAYRDFLRQQIFPAPLCGDEKALIAARRALMTLEAVELLSYPWRYSDYVTADDIAAAGLGPVPANRPIVTRRAIGRMLWKQHGDDDAEPYERRAARNAQGWIQYGLVEERVHRPNLKELRGTARLHALMQAYYVTFAREASSSFMSTALSPAIAHA
ncbi:MAG: hypothetical protein JNJ63_00505 [Hyphomonadaceae bacterium]|nr:hypothetical protein [Hyphomonadaceae bacterium]